MIAFFPRFVRRVACSRRRTSSVDMRKLEVVDFICGQCTTNATHGYHMPSSFHHIDPMPSQMIRFTTEIRNPSRHQVGCET